MKFEEIRKAFNYFDFEIKNLIYVFDGIEVIAVKDYSKKFNISFDGVIELKIKINPLLQKSTNINTYPVFTEITNKIPKRAQYHIYPNGTICYAPPERPFDEKWDLKMFVSAVDAMVNDFFNMKYIGKSSLRALNHGKRGLEEYRLFIK